jgi:hypothetical protein
MLLLKTACFVAAGLNIGLVVVILATFGPSWGLTVAAYGFAILVITIFITAGRLLYRAGYQRAQHDKLAAPRRALGPTEMNFRSDGG